MKTHSHARRSLVEDEEADARISAFFIISAVLTVALIFVYIIAPPANIGVKEGQQAPEILGQAYQNGAWSDFQLTDHINRSWNGSGDGQWILLQFMDTDCPHCWREAADMSEHWPVYGETGAVLYITVSVDIVGNDHSREETIAFKEKLDREGCKGTSNCADRPGAIHPWRYVDGLGTSVKDDYRLPGVPFELLLSPDGKVAWNGAQHKNDGLEDVDAALRHHLMEAA